MIFFLIHKVTMGFAVIGVINGVLMQETFKVASYDVPRSPATFTRKCQGHDHDAYQAESHAEPHQEDADPLRGGGDPSHLSMRS